MRRDSFTTLAYFLADAAHPSAEQTALALDLAKSALASGREPDAVLLHVYARALSASGDIKGAREAQNRPVRAPRPRHHVVIPKRTSQQVDFYATVEIA